MIVRNDRHYYGLHLIDTAITDTDPKSPNYLRITDLPTQLTSGRNLIKLYGNAQAFLPGSILYVEVLDSEGKVLYSEIPDFIDSGRRRLLIIKIDDDAAPGPALITVISSLKNELVPPQYRDRVNFKWQTQINVVKYESNISEIIYKTPPEVLLQTRIRPFVTTSFRNSEETSTREYGDYEFFDYGFDDYVGDKDSSGNIFQRDKAYKQLSSFTSASISSFNRNNSFYLKKENYSAKTINKNYPDLFPGQGFFVQFGDNIVNDYNFSLPTSNWESSAGTLFGTSPGRGTVVLQNAGWMGTQINTIPGQYYLVAIDSKRTAGRSYNFSIGLGYDANRNSGSISQNVYVSIPGTATTSDWETSYSVIRASDAGSYFWIFRGAEAGASIDNARVHPLIPLGYDFKHETDVIGGYIKVPRPEITPNYSTEYTIIPTYTPSGIISGSTAYTSYIDFILQERDAAVDNRFKYQIIPEYQIKTPTSYTPKEHRINRFISNPRINYTNIDGIDFIHQYAQEFSFDDPTNPAIPHTAGTLVGKNAIYGNFYIGGQFGLGGLYKYDITSKQFNILHNFSGKPGGSTPDTKPLFLNSLSGFKMYGTTFYGGKYDSGSIYEHDINTGTTSIRYSFGKTSASGYQPAGPLIQASNGLLYGTVFGPYALLGDGLIYSFNTASGVYSIVHRSGSYGYTNLIEHNGELWGTSNYGGSNNSGTIFRLNLTTNDFNIEYDFPGGAGKPTGLVMGDPGVFYGTTYEGNTIFTYVSGGSGYSTLYTMAFNEGSKNERPPLLDNGYLYGTCWEGGANGIGSVFRYRLSDGNFDVIHSFQTNPDGNRPKSSLLRIGSSLYGTTTFGGNNGNGTIFRIDRDGIFRPYVEESSGIIYHKNAIVPYEIPATSNLIEDYPRWTGPVIVGGTNNLYSIIELEIRNLEPLTGDISKVQLYAKPKGVRSEFVDLGVYPTTPVDVLLDNNFVNHVQFIDSPYRLTGYFKPTITKTTEARLESFPFEIATFANGWSTGSITGSYFKNETFHTFISVSATPESNAPFGSSIKFVLNELPTSNGLAYAVYTASSVPAINEEVDMWQQISYNLFSAGPFQAHMDLSSSNYYTGSYSTTNINLNSVLMYAGLVSKTGSINIEDIFAISPNLNSNYSLTGSSVSASSYAHALTFNGKLGWKTDTFLIPKEVAVTQSLYPALFFEYNTKNQEILGNTIDNLYPHIVEISNISCREVGDRDYIRDKYWQAYTYVKETGTLVTSASITSNTTVLADSAKLDVIDNVIGISSSRAVGYVNNNRLVFQTVDSYKFYKSVPYIISFNAVSELETINAISPIELGDPKFLSVWSGPPTNIFYQEFGHYLQIGFDTNVTSRIRNQTFAAYSGQFLIEITTGPFEHFSLDNPISLNVRFPISNDSQTIDNIKPFTTYKFILNGDVSGDTEPIVTFTSTYVDPKAIVFLTSYSIRRFNYDFFTKTSLAPITPTKSNLRVFGVNSEFGIPFADQLATPEIGEFIGELEHKREFSNNETKNFGRVEMEFEAETDGFGYIAFESDLGATWYISDISIKPKDRIGSTPGVTRLFVKIPNDLVNKPLTFKVEYLNDIDQKAPYNTILNDVVFSNINEQQSGTNSSVNTSVPPTVTGNTNTSGPNSSAAVN